MSTLLQIMNIIVKQSMFKDFHIQQSKNKALLDMVSGTFGIGTMRKKEIATFVVIITNELKLYTDTLTKKERLSFFDKEIPNDYTKLNSGNFNHTSILVRMLNTYDKDSVAFEPLLNELKADTGQELSTIILPELKRIHTEWLSIYKRADGFLKLELNEVPPEDVEALRCMADSGIFDRIFDFKQSSFREDLLNPEYYLFFKYSPLEHLTSSILRRYEKILDFVINESDGLYIISRFNRYYLFGVDKEKHLVCKRLDEEFDLHGYPIDFSNSDSDPEKSESIRLLLEMSQNVSSLLNKSKLMSPKEAMAYAFESTLSAGNIPLYDYSKNWFIFNPEEFRAELIKFTSDEIGYVCFSDVAKSSMLEFINTLTDEQLSEQQLEQTKQLIDTSPILST
ncbi:hypothetical protein [Pseudomonas sp. NBRC 111118]|uniref:hypothetical protein n=1 Tax=Pseudomonas sp. NBRC 111118 TaxID=1661033 RepID=UPI0012E28C5E|nr:hypothetical protein [Pseudomonas sp. NBRC 111118]